MCEAFFGRERSSAGKDWAIPMLAPYLKPLDVVAVFMGDNKGVHVVYQQSEFRHAFERFAARQSVIDHNEPLRALDECAVAFRATAEDMKVQTRHKIPKDTMGADE